MVFLYTAYFLFSVGNTNHGKSQYIFWFWGQAKINVFFLLSPWDYSCLRVVLKIEKGSIQPGGEWGVTTEHKKTKVSHLKKYQFHDILSL